MCELELLCGKREGRDLYAHMKATVRHGGQAAFTNAAEHLAHREKYIVKWDAEENAYAAAQLQRSRSRNGGAPFKASVGVSRGCDLATPGRKFSNRLESNRPATSSGHLTISLDGNQPTISVGNLLASPAGIKHAEPGHSGGSSLSATAKVFLSNAAMQAHTEPEQACLNSMFWPPDVNADADSAPTATES